MAKDEKQTQKRTASSHERQLERLAADGEKKAKNVEAAYAKGGVLGAASAQFGGSLSQDNQQLLKAAEKMAQQGEIDTKGLSDMAGLLGKQAGLSDDKLGLIKAAGGDQVDMDRVASVPGVTVDKDTGKFSVLGLVELDAKDPTSRMIANLAGAGYSLVAQNVNEFALGRVYNAARDAALKTEGLRPNAHALGMAAATSVVAGVSFWPDINKAIQQEKQGKKDMAKIAERFAPLLDEYAPSRQGRLDQFFSVAPQANQMIANERKRASANQNAQRFRNTVEALGRVPLFAASMGYGLQKIKGAGEQTAQKAEDASKKRKGETPSQAKRRLLKEKTAELQKDLGLDAKDAAKLAMEELAEAAKEPAAQEGGMFGRFKRDVVSGGVLAAAPLATMIANNLYKKRLEDRGIQPVSASDMVEALGKQLDQDPKAERFKLPEGMSELGSKTGNNQLKLEDYIEQLFRQHERDTYGNDATIPERFSEQLREASQLIAQTIREDKMDGRLALIKLVGEQQVVRSGGRFVEDIETVKERLSKLEEALFLKESVDPKAQLKETGIAPEVVREQWGRWSDEERGFAALTLNPQVVEYAGIPAVEVDAVCQRFRDDYATSFDHVVKNLASLDDKALKENGASSSDIKVLHKAVQKADNDNHDKDQPLTKMMSRSELADTRQVVANLVFSQGAELDGRLAAGTHLARQ